MKVKVNTKKEFQPIELTITIESEEELCDLWHRLNVSKNVADTQSNNDLKHRCIDTYSLWNEIDDLVDINNLKNK